VSSPQPPLQRFYDSLSDEQKARFNSVNAKTQPVRAGRGNSATDLSQICSGQAGTNVPTDRIVQALKPTDSQRSALDALNAAKEGDAARRRCRPRLFTTLDGLKIDTAIIGAAKKLARRGGGCIHLCLAITPEHNLPTSAKAPILKSGSSRPTGGTNAIS
jgi:hypothetical protein